MGRDGLPPPLNPAPPLPGNMWAQSWVNILDLALPFPEKPPEDITKIMQGQVSIWAPVCPAHPTAPGRGPKLCLFPIALEARENVPRG